MKKTFVFCILLIAFSGQRSLFAKESPAAPDTVELLRSFIRIDTTNPPGHEIALAEYIKNYLEGYDIPAEIVESMPGRANLLARLKGSGAKGTLLLLGHLDVVTADPQEWKHPPFAAEIEDNYLYGRGAMDMKGMVALEIATLVKIKQASLPLAGDVLLVLVADEEAGGKLGAEFLTEHEWEKIHPTYVLNEGSIGLIRGDLHLYPIQVAEKGVAWMKLTANGNSGHGAMPTSDNAVLTLIHALNRITAKPQPIQKTAIVEIFLQRLAENFSFPKSFLMRHFFSWPIRKMLPWIAGSKLETEKLFNAMLRNTIVPTVLQAGSKTNVIPGEAQAQIDCRILPGETPEGFRKKIESLINNPNVKVELTTQSLPTESDFHTPYFDALEKAILDNDPKAIIVPYISPGATDNHFFRAKGVVSYGIIPMLISMEDLEGLHGKNERILLSELKRGEKILYDLVSSLQGL